MEPHDAVTRIDMEQRVTFTFEHFFVPEEVEWEAEQAGLRVRHHERPVTSPPIVVLGRMSN
jgi:hypothetical protein